MCNINTRDRRYFYVIYYYYYLSSRRRHLLRVYNKIVVSYVNKHNMFTNGDVTVALVVTIQDTIVHIIYTI